MLMRTDSAREFDRWTNSPGTASRPAAMPMDAWREGDAVVVELDIPGVRSDAIELDVDRNVVTVHAERSALGSEEVIAAERPRGVYARQLVLGDNLDVTKIGASYESGVLTLTIPVAEHAKPRKIAVSRAGRSSQPIPA